MDSYLADRVERNHGYAFPIFYYLTRQNRSSETAGYSFVNKLLLAGLDDNLGIFATVKKGSVNKSFIEYVY